MTNPNNAIGTNAAFSGRTSPNALNDITASFTAGIISGWECQPKTGMTIQLGGQVGTRDVALAEDNAGNKLTINNRSGAPVEVTLGGAPSTNNRVDAIVAYIDNPSTGDGNTTDNPTTCGIIAVSGTVAANPTAPSEATIRSAITTDGATGGTAYYIVLATVYVGTNVTTIGSGVITSGTIAQVEAAQNKAATDFMGEFNINQFGTFPKADLTLYKCSVGWGNLRTASNTSGSMGKIYGFLGDVMSTSSSTPGYIRIQTTFRPTSDITILDAILMMQPTSNPNNESFVRNPLKFYTTGIVEIPIDNYYYNRRYNFWLPPCLYFMKDFGDTPDNP